MWLLWFNFYVAWDFVKLMFLYIDISNYDSCKHSYINIIRVSYIWLLFAHSLYIFRYFIFTSFWAYKIYYVYGFMLLVFVILMIVTVCVTIVCTYFLLNAEDYRW